MNIFTECGIIPDVLDAAPQHILSVSWSIRLFSFFSIFHKVEFPTSTREQGPILPDDRVTHITPHEAHKQPIIKYPNDGEREMFTIVMCDPDAPSREHPTNAEWLHWLVVNVPGGDVSKGHVLAEYHGPAPPAGTGDHRYVLLVYKQKYGRLQMEPKDDVHLGRSSAKGRANWKLKSFINEYPLIQPPVAGNIFLSRH